MRMRFLALAALVLGLASCQQEPAVVNPVGGEVDFQLTVDALNPDTRAGENGAADSNAAKDSAFGAVDYFQGANWNEVDLRYTLEVYDYDEVKDEVGALVKARMTKVVDEYTPVAFDLRLVPNRMYRFVVVADFVAEGAGEDYNGPGLHHDITSLAEIKVINDSINDECTDAYFAFEDIKIENSNPHSIVLRRPYAKLRVIATDMEELNLNLDPAKVVITYQDAPLATAFNALTGEITTTTTTVSFTKELATDLSKHVYTAGYDALSTHMTIFTDYILAKDEQNSLQFTMDVYDQHDVLIKSTEFDTEIPVQRNNLTTIIGNVLTTATEIDVTIDDNFANENREYYVFEAFVNGGEVTLTEDLVVGRTLFVEEGVEATLNLNGHSIINDSRSEELGEGDGIIVYGKLNIVGDGTIQGNTRSVWARGNTGAEVNIYGGHFIGAVGGACEVVYASGNGEVNIYGGTFEAKTVDQTSFANKNPGVWAALNLHGSATGHVLVYGGRFYKFDPAQPGTESASWMAAHPNGFVADGFASTFDGVDTYVVAPALDYVDCGTYIEVYTAKGLMKWAYAVNELGKLDYGMVLMNNINMPAFTIANDDANETYKFTTTPITVTEGVPSGSNWNVVCTNVSALTDGYTGNIDGQNFTINGLRVVQSGDYAGFIGFMYDGGEVKNLTFNDAVVNGGSATGVAVGRAQDGIAIENVHVKNSTIKGKSEVGAIAGRIYRRTYSSDGVTNYDEDVCWIKNCSTDENTAVIGSNDSVGGICGYNYGSIIYNAVNNADVTGRNYVGGIVGYSRDYAHHTDGYIIASKTTAKSTVTATNGHAGGVVGYLIADNRSHQTTMAWVVACQSEATLSGRAKGAINSYMSYRAGVSGSWALYNGATTLVASGVATDAVFGYNSVSEATQADVDAMNAAIEAFNSSAVNTDNITVTERWVLTSNGPVLQ